MQGPRKDTAGAAVASISSYKNRTEMTFENYHCSSVARKVGSWRQDTLNGAWDLERDVYEENGCQPVRFPSAPSKNDNTEKKNT